MAKYLIITLALVASALGDDGYAAPAGGYASPPQEAYGSPQPAYDGYGAPDVAQPAYEAAPSYDYDAGGADAASVGGDLFDLNKILELLPLFLAVFAAIIVAQLFAPLLGMLFGIKVGAATSLLAPLGPAKIGLMNAILGPFGLVLATAGSTTGTLAAARSLAEGFTMRSNPEMIGNVADFLYSAIQGKCHPPPASLPLSLLDSTFLF